MRFNVTAVGRGLGPAAETMRHIVRYSGRRGRRRGSRYARWLGRPAETVRHIVRGTSNQTRRSVSLPQRGKGDREAVDEVLKRYGISFG